MNFMIDLETMGNTPDAPIVAIGAVAFSREGLGAEFSAGIDLESAMAQARPSASTIKWWLTQGEAARKRVAQGSLLESDALLRLREFLHEQAGGKREVMVWGNGAAFDIVILESAYRRWDWPPPWEFWNVYCYRTLKNLFGKRFPAPPFKGTAHTALDDARNQARHAVEILKGVYGI